jgi:hypothetical protein
VLLLLLVASLLGSGSSPIQVQGVAVLAVAAAVISVREMTAKQKLLWMALLCPLCIPSRL